MDDRPAIEERDRGRPAGRRGRVLVLLLLIVAAVVWAAVVGWLDVATIQQHHREIRALAQAHPQAAAALYALAFALATALSIPGLLLLTAFGGYLFGWVLASALVLPSLVAGACAAFLVARSTVGAPLRERARAWAGSREEPVRDGVWYVISLRLLGFLPMGVRNVLPALVGIPLPTFALGTALGQLPATLVQTNLGEGIGDLLDEETFEPGDLANPHIALAFAGLALLALLPPLIRRWRR
jgi:uncharacterized membrane protein YdjX (TVP38/TMEM64 family)